jgi:hypothetical protein
MEQNLDAYTGMVLYATSQMTFISTHRLVTLRAWLREE